MDPNLKIYLEERGISFIEHKHPAVFTVEESKFLKKSIPGLHTKNLFLKDDKSNYYLVCMPAEKRLDMKNMRKTLKVQKLHFASPDELKKEINLTPGSVSIFGMIYSKKERPVKLLLDKEVWEAKIVGFHPNVNTATLEVTHDNLVKFCESLPNKAQIIEINGE